MNVYHCIDDIQYDKCFLCRPIPNKFYNYIHFYKISYNLLSLTLNSILIWIDLKQYNLKETNDQYVISYTMDETFLEKVIQFEKNLLDHFNHTLQKKIQLPSYDLKHLFYHKHKVDQFRLFFRISGIWESETHIGLTSKIDIYPST
jgi:hypothetical protein